MMRVNLAFNYFLRRDKCVCVGAGGGGVRGDEREKEGGREEGGRVNLAGVNARDINEDLSLLCSLTTNTRMRKDVSTGALDRLRRPLELNPQITAVNRLARSGSDLRPD